MSQTRTGREATLQRYLEFWNSSAESEWRANAAEVFSKQVAYVAPIGALDGSDALIAFGRQLVGHVGEEVRFRATGEPEFHHDRARLRWAITVGNNPEFAAGTDVIVFDDHDRICSVTAFLDKAPEGFDPDAVHE